MSNLPRLELTENPNKKSDFIIFRNPIKNKNSKKQFNRKSKKHVYKNTVKKNNRKTKRNRKKGFFSIFL